MPCEHVELDHPFSVAEELTALLSAYRGTHVIYLDENKQKENERNREAIAEAMYYFNAGLLFGLQHATPPEQKTREGFKPPKI